MADDSVPLDVGVEQVAELFQNQRNRPFKGWSSRYLLKSDPGRYSDYAGGGGRDKLDVRPPRGWAWAHGDKGWEVDLTYTQCDPEGWTYATSFRDFTSSNVGLPAPAEHGTRVRRRRFIRRRVVVEDEHYDEDGSEDGGSAVSVFSRRGRSLGGGSASSRGSRMQASRASVGFALAALEEQSSVKSIAVEVVMHGESFVISAGPNDRVAWLQEEAMARFSREHNFATHVVQVVETYTRDIFQYTPEVGHGEETDAGVQPLDPLSLLSEALSARDGKLIRPAPMEDGFGNGVPDVRVWGRLQATVVVPPGPLGVVLDGEIADRPVVLEVQGRAGPVTMMTPASTPPPATETGIIPAGTAASSPASTSRATGPKVSRKDRMKRLLLGLAMKEFPQETEGPERRPIGSGASPQPDAGGGAAKGGFFGSTVGASASASPAVSPSGRGRAVLSPLLSATDSATVRPGMLLTSVAARSGQGVSQEPVDTIGMGVKEAIETLVRYQHLHRSITFLDPPPGVTSGRGLDEGGGAASTGVTCPFAVSVTVVEATGIKRSELFNADPFAWVRLGGTSQKTKVRKSTSRPFWDETFRFMVLSLERSMLVQLWDADEIGADVLLGEATVNLESFSVNHPFKDDSLVLDSWYKLEGSSNTGNVRLKVKIDQQLRVAIHRKKVDSAARLLQGAMRSFVLRRQTVGRRKSGAPPLPPRSSRGSSFSAPGADAGEAVFAAADAAANVSRGQGSGAGNKAAASGKSGVSRKPSRKSVAGAVGGAWEASGAHAASTLVDVFPAEDVDIDESSRRTGKSAPGKLSRESAVGVGRGTFGGGAVNGVSPLVVKFLEGPGLERFGGGTLFQKNSTSTTGGRRSTLTYADSDRRSSNSVRFLHDGRRSTVGGWGEHDEAARPGASVCKDCLSDVASLLALAMTPARAVKTVMEDAAHLRYPTSLSESPPPLAVAAFPAPRGGFGPLTVTSVAAFPPLCGENWADQAAPVLVAPCLDGAAAVAAAAGEVWEKASRGNGAASSSTGITSGVVSGVLGGVVGAGGGSAAGVAPFAGKASVTIVLNGGGYISLIPGEEFQYWRWASALLLAVSGGTASMTGIGNTGEDPESFRGVVREVKTSFPGGNPEKIAESMCTLRSGAGKLSWSSTVRGQAFELPLTSAKGVVLSNAHAPACKFLFTVTVVSGCLDGIADGGASRSGGRLQSYCRVEAGAARSRTKIAVGATPFWNHRCTFAVSEAEALSPGGGARICCLSHRVAYQDTQIGESFIPFASLTSGKDYTETLDISGNLRRFRLTLHSAQGLVSSDVTGVTDPYCVVLPIRLDGTEVTSERGETSWQRSGLLRRDEWEETFELGRWCAPEEVKGIKVFIMDRDISRKDETLGEVFIPASMFKESKARRTKTNIKVDPPPPMAKRYSKTLGKYNVLGGRGNMSSASGSNSPRRTQDLGTLCVSMSVIEMDPSELTRAGSGGLPPGGIKIRCSLDIADEFSCAWPALLLRHGSPSTNGGGAAGDDEDEDDDDDSGGEAGTGVAEAGRVERWRVSAGFGGLILSPVASGEGAAADSSPFIRIDPAGPADDFLMEVYENQRKRQPWGWGSGRKRHLKPSDPGRFSDTKGENRLHVKLLDQVEVPAGWAWSASEWSIAGGDCPSDKDGWTYGREPTFDALLRDPASGLSKEQKGTCVRRRRWVRPLYRTGVGRSPPRTGIPSGGSRAVSEATVDIPEGLVPFCRGQSDGSVIVLVHENQRYQPGAGWGSSDEDHLLPEDRAPLTGAAGVHPIDDLDDILPSSIGPAFHWEGEVDDHDEVGWYVGPWTYAERFSDISMDLPRDPPASDPAGSSPKSPPPHPSDRPAGVRSRVWWRVMVTLEGGGPMARGMSVSGKSSSRQSSAHLGQPARRKAAHTGGSGGGSGGGAGGAQGDRVKIPLERLKRAAVVGPNTLIVEVDVEVSREDSTWSVGDERQPATLIIGPCDAPRLGSLLVERTATAKARAALGQVVRRARRLTAAPPPLPPRPSAKRGEKGSWAASGKSGFSESPRGRSVRPDRWALDKPRAASSGNPAVNNGSSSPSPRRALSPGYASNARASANPFGTDQTRDASPVPQTSPRFTSNSVSSNPFGTIDARGVSPHPRRPSESRSTSTSNNPFLPRDESNSPGTYSTITPAWSPGTSPRRARRGGEAGLLENVITEAVDLLQNAGRAVAALDDAYNAAYNASAATDGWGAGGHDAAELGEAVLWTLWSRLVRLQAYLRQLIADTPAQDLKLPAAAKRGDWGVLVENMDAEAAKQRSEILAEAPVGARRDSAYRAEEDGVEVESRDVGEGANMEGSMRAVEGLCNALDRQVTEMLLCADTFPESMLRKAVQVLATQCYTKVADEVGRHVTFRYEGLLPLADQQLLVLLDILVNKADMIERTLQPRLDLVGWRAVPPPLLTKAISVPWLLGAYATSIESKLSGLFRNILETNQEAMEFPPEASEGGSEQSEGSSGSKSPLHRRMKRGIVGGGGSRSKDHGTSAQPQGFTMWTLHESTEKPLSVVPTTAMTLLDTYVVTVARRFPDDAGVQAIILRAGAGALGCLRNIISAHTEASVTSCPERGWDKLLRFLCATANDCWQLVAESVPSIEERHPRAMAEGAEEVFETLKQLWMVLGVSCCRKAARLVLGFMQTDELFALEGMHEAGAEQSLVEIREALEYYCFNFLRSWLQEYFYHKVLVRMCDHIVVWAVQGLVRAAVARRAPLDQGQLLRLKACRDTLAGTLEACSQRESSAPDGPGEGGGMYERRLGFLDDIIELLTVPQNELEGVFTGMLQRHIHCQRSVQHALQVVLSLRADGATVPEAVSKWADEANWMGGDAVVLSSDTAEIEPFHRVFRRPLSALRADPAPLVAPTVLAQASDAHRRPLLAFGESSSTDEGVAKEGRGGNGGGRGPGGAGGPIGWSTRALGLAGGPSFGTAIAGIARNAGGRSSTGSGSGRKRGMRDVMSKFRRGAKCKASSGDLMATAAPGSEAVVMEGVGVTSAGPVTLLQVMILEAEGLRNVAVLRKTDSYVTAHLSSRTGAREARTSVKKNTCHPKWSEPISFRVPSDSLVATQLHLRVMGKQKLREDICLGHVELPLAGIGKAGDGFGVQGGKWFPLEDGQGKLRIDAELVTRRPSLVV